ncbi:MAG: PQQ-binding-like beta-propeller repeat protein, partial [Candidatus Latescibacteria bacterium]|nr:PQQ-binding-like beta-propeller repeat protein [Candidatus Latescibacterota bacterium]
MKMGNVLISGLLALALAIPVHAGERLWIKEFKKNVKYKRLTAGGVYLVLTEEGLHGLDPETGYELWTYTREKLEPDDLEYIEGTPFLLIAEGKGFPNRTVNISTINVMDGTETWKFGGISGMLVGSQVVFEHGLLLLATMGGRDGININAYDAVDGAHRYQVAFPDDQRMKKVNMARQPGAGTFSTKLKIIGHQEPIIDGNQIIVFYDYLRSINLNSGEQEWMDMTVQDRPVEKDVPMLSKYFAQMELRDGVLYTAYGKGLAAFDVKSGEMKWRVKNVPGEVVSALHIEGNKLYYRAGAVMNGSGKKAKMLKAVYNGVNLADGSPIWTGDVNLDGNVTNWAFTEDRIYVGSPDRLYTIDRATGSHGTPAESKKTFDFKDGAPHTITYRAGDLLVQGAQTVALYDLSDDDLNKEKWRQYYKSPGSQGRITKLTTGAGGSMAAKDAAAWVSRSFSSSANNR